MAAPLRSNAPHGHCGGATIRKKMVYFDYFVKQQLIKEISLSGAWVGPGYYVEILLILLITAILCGI